MTSAISRPASAGAHAHGYAKPAGGDKPADGFEALLTAFAGGAAPLPIDPRNERKGSGESGANEEPASSTSDIARTATLAGTGIEIHAPRFEYVAANDKAVLAKPSSVQEPVSMQPAVNARPEGEAANVKEPRPETQPTSRTTLSPRAAVQEALVALVRSPGRPRPAPPPEESKPVEPEIADAAKVATPPSHATASNATQAPPAIAMPEIETITIPAPAAKPSASSRAAADIARQRQFALAADASPVVDTNLPTELSEGSAFQTMVALHKADGALGNDSAARADSAISAPASPGAWIGNLPSATHAASGANPLVAPRTFDQAAWSEALARQVAATATAAARETGVRLEPEGLGPIEVRVRVEAERVDVRFAIEHPVTVNMVRAALPDLERLLAQSGMSLGQANVAQQNANGREHAAPRTHASGARGEIEDASSTSAAIDMRPRTRVGLLDDFV